MRAPGLFGNRPRRCDGVELVRVVQRRGLGGARRTQVVVHRDGVQQLGGRADAPRATRSPRCTWPRSRPSSVGRNAGGGPSSRVRPMSCTSAAASRRSARSRGWSCASSWQIVATPTVCSSSPPAYEWWPSSVAGYAFSGVSASTVETSARSDSSWISDVSTSRNPSSSFASRRSAGASAAGSASAGSSARTSSWSRSRNFSTRPRTCTASPSPKRASSSSTSFHTRPEMRPVVSPSSSARYGAPLRVCSFCFFSTA